MIKKFREYVMKNRRSINNQFYWIIIFSLSFIIVIGVIKTNLLLTRTYEVQRFYNYSSTIILYNNSYFSFYWSGPEDHCEYTNGRWELVGDTIIMNLIGKDRFGEFPIFRNAKYVIHKDSIVLKNKYDNSYEVLYPFNHDWVYHIHDYWTQKEYFYKEFKLNY